MEQSKIHVPNHHQDVASPELPAPPGLRVLSQRPALRGRARQLQARQAAGRHLGTALVVSSMERLGFLSDDMFHGILGFL